MTFPPRHVKIFQPDGVSFVEEHVDPLHNNNGSSSSWSNNKISKNSNIIVANPKPNSRFHSLLCDLANEYERVIAESGCQKDAWRSSMASRFSEETQFGGTESRSNVDTRKVTIAESESSNGEINVEKTMASTARPSVCFEKTVALAARTSVQSVVSTLTARPSTRSVASGRPRYGDGIGSSSVLLPEDDDAIPGWQDVQEGTVAQSQNGSVKKTLVSKATNIDSAANDSNADGPERSARSFYQDMTSTGWRDLQHQTTTYWVDDIRKTMTDIKNNNLPKGGVQRRSRFMLSPIGKPRMLWDLLWCFSLAYDMWWSMLLLVFTSVPDEGLSICQSLSFATMCFWICDIVLNFSTGYVVDGRHLVLDRKFVILIYARTWLCFDLVLTFPFDKVIEASSGSGTVSMLRIAKATKVVKLAKALKLLRAIKLLQMGKRSQFLKANHWVAEKGGVLVPFISLLGFFVLFSHFHGCLWASVKPDWHPTRHSAVALLRYQESFWWAYGAITFGTEVRSTSLAPALVEALLCCERLVFAGFLGTFVVLKTMTYFHRYTQLLMAQNDMTAYLKDHDVGAETQIEVLYSFHETARAMKVQQNFHAVADELPLELRRRICKELWSATLLTLQLIEVAAEWHDDLVVETAQFVKEEVYASKAVVCREGDPAIAAYCVLQGKIEAISAFRKAPIPLYIPGHWMGERALVRIGLTRSATATCLQYSSVLMVPVRPFQKLLEKLEIHEVFEDFVENDMIFLCGRCGQIGKHNSDKCPSLEASASR